MVMTRQTLLECMTSHLLPSIGIFLSLIWYVVTFPVGLTHINAYFHLKLKNSGTTGDDVKVSYIASDDREIPIESQTDFQIALYTFRRKARNNEIITLTLDRMSNFKMSSPKQVHHLDVQTQVYTDALECKEADLEFNGGPPEWFKKYMKKVRKMNEITC